MAFFHEQAIAIAFLIATTTLVACRSSPKETTEENGSTSDGLTDDDVRGLPEAGVAFAPGAYLLPFDIRLAKLARVVGVPVTDPMFDALRKSRFELGDHNYAAGIKPDLASSPARIGGWVKGLKPVCAAKVMRDKYPLPAQLEKLISAAYGRPATPEDRAAFTDGMSMTLDAESAQLVLCLSTLSSLEFVSR